MYSFYKSVKTALSRFESLWAKTNIFIIYNIVWKTLMTTIISDDSLEVLISSVPDLWSKEVTLKGQGHMVKAMVKVSFVLNQP